MHAKEIAARLGDAKKTNGGWICRCPAHADKNPSLSITDTAEGNLLWHCHAGCSQTDVMAALKKLGLLQQQQTSIDSHHIIPKTFNDHRIKQTWTYRDADNKSIGHVVRYEKAGKKIVVPFFRRGEKVVVPFFRRDKKIYRAGNVTPRPLYNQNDFAGRKTIIICEGEKCVDELKKYGLLATTSPGGSNAAQSADWSVLRKFRLVIIWPDNDAPGIKYQNAVTQHIKKINSNITIKYVDIKKLDLPISGDVCDLTDGQSAKLKKGFTQLITLTSVPNQLITLTSVPNQLRNVSEILKIHKIEKSQNGIALMTDMENAERFFKKTQDIIKCHSETPENSHGWVQWNGRVWENKKNTEMLSLANGYIKKMFVKAVKKLEEIKEKQKNAV